MFAGNYPNDLCEFINKNKISQDQIQAILLYNSIVILYYWS